MNRKLALIAFLLFITAFAWPQASVKPGPEVKKLDCFVGNWTTEGTIGQGPWGAGGKFSATTDVEWMPGGFFLVSHRSSSLPAELGGDVKGTTLMGYDTNDNVYTLDEFDSQGRRTTWKGTVNGDTWIWTGSENYAGQEIKQKMTIKILSPTSHTMKFEVSLDGTNFMPFMDTKATKK